MSKKIQTPHLMHALGNLLILTAIILVVASTAYFFSKGIDLGYAYAELLGNSIGATALTLMVFAGVVLPLGDTKKDRKAKLTSLTNRSLVSMFMVNLILIPALGILSNVQIFLVLDVVLLVMALTSSTLQLTATTRRIVATTSLEVLGSLLIVLAAVVQMLTTDILPMQLRESSWITSLLAMAAGIVLLLFSRKMQKMFQTSHSLI